MALCAALFFLVTTTDGRAQDVTLTSPDGTVEIGGTLLGFDGEFYRVDTRFGELTIDGSGVRCEGPGCPNLAGFVAEVTFSGESTMADAVMPALVETFALRNGLSALRETRDSTHFRYLLRDENSGEPVARFSFRATTTDEGFADLLANEADAVMALREIRPQERARAQAAGLGDMTGAARSRVLALDALVPVVAAANPVRRISVPQLAQVLSGQIANWSELGGPGAPISVHLPIEGSGLVQALEDKVMAPAGLALLPDALRHRSSGELVAALADDPFGLGFTSFSTPGVTRALALTGGCGHTLEASRRTIKTEDYPLTSPMFLYLPARRLPRIAREFLAFTRGPAAQIVIRRSGLVDQMPEQIPINVQGNRLANAILSAGSETPLGELQRMIALLDPLVRLSTSVRFEAGSTRPDAQSRANILMLAHALETGAYDGRGLMFVGFSDGDGSAEVNRAISETRATAVRNAVLDAAQAADIERIQIDVAGFGEALPMACDDSAWGRQVNRRVEVWLR